MPDMSFSPAMNRQTFWGMTPEQRQLALQHPAWQSFFGPGAGSPPLPPPGGPIGPPPRGGIPPTVPPFEDQPIGPPGVGRPPTDERTRMIGPAARSPVPIDVRGRTLR